MMRFLRIGCDKWRSSLCLRYLEGGWVGIPAELSHGIWQDKSLMTLLKEDTRGFFIVHMTVLEYQRKDEIFP